MKNGISYKRKVLLQKISSAKIDGFEKFYRENIFKIGLLSTQKYT